MRTVIKVWRREPALFREPSHANPYLSHFQDGIGNTVLDDKLLGDMVAAAAAKQAIELTGPKGESFRRWVAWSKVSTSEMEILR